jgi:hypothetical protein
MSRDFKLGRLVLPAGNLVCTNPNTDLRTLPALSQASSVVMTTTPVTASPTQTPTSGGASIQATSAVVLAALSAAVAMLF